MIIVNDFSKLNNYKSKFNEHVTLLYNGKIKAKAIFIKNPYFHEINDLNIFLGYKKVKNDSENNIQKENKYIVVGKNFISNNNKKEFKKNNTLIGLRVCISSRNKLPKEMNKNKILRIMTDRLLKKYNGDFLINIFTESYTYTNLKFSQTTICSDIYKKGKI